MAMLPFALLVAAAVAKTVGTISAANSKKNADQYNAHVADTNADVASQQGEANALLARQRAAAATGGLRAGLAANGVDADLTGEDLLEQSARNGELDVQNARYNARLKELSYRSQAALDRADASSTMKGAYFSAAGIALSTAASAYSMSATSSAGVADAGGQGGGTGLTMPKNTGTSF